MEESNSDFVMLIITMNTVRLIEQARTASNLLHKVGGNGKAILVAVMVPPIIVTSNCRHSFPRVAALCIAIVWPTSCAT